MSLPVVKPQNPAEIGAYPPTLPIELALRVDTVEKICEAYGISHDEWLELRADPVFQRDLSEAVKLVKKEGMSFKLKAQLQSEVVVEDQLEDDPCTCGRGAAVGQGRPFEIYRTCGRVCGAGRKSRWNAERPPDKYQFRVRRGRKYDQLHPSGNDSGVHQGFPTG